MRRALLPRATLADRGVAALVATLCAFIVLGAAGATGWLRLTADDMAAGVFAEARHQARQLQVYYSEVSEETVPDDAGQVLAASLAPSVRAMLEPPRHVAVTTEAMAETLPRQPVYSPSFLSVAGFPQAQDLIDVVEGEFPRPGRNRTLLPRAHSSTYDGPRRVWVVEVALERRAARAMDAHVGTYIDLVHRFRVDPDDRTLLKVSGLYAPAAAGPSPLDDVNNARRPAISTLPEFNLVRSAALAADDETVLQATWGPEPEVRWTFDPAGLPDAARAEAVVGDARRLTVQPWPPVVTSTASASVTGIGDLATAFLAEREVRDTLAAVVLASLAAAALALLLAAASVLELRRREVSDVLRARGAGTRQLATARAAEAALLAAPGLGVAAALAALTDLAPVDMVPALAAAGVCVALLTVAQVAPWRGLPDRVRGPASDALQMAAVLLAVAVGAVMLTRDRLAASDPLLLALPVLLGLAAAVLTVRAVRRGAALVQGLAARSSRLTPVVGAAQVGESARHVLLPVLAIVLATSSGLLAAAVGDTLREGAERAAWAAVGADVLVTGGHFDEEMVGRVHALAGVHEVAEVHVVDGLLATATGQEKVSVLAVDPSTWERVTGGAPGAVEAPGVRGSRLEAVVSSDLEISGGEATFGYAQATVPVTVAHRAEAIPGLASDRFVVVDAEGLREAAGRRLLRSQALLLSGSPDVEGLRELVQEVWPDARVTSRAGVASTTLADPVLSRISWVAGASAPAAVLVALFAAGLAVALGRPLRRRTWAVLRALGASLRQARLVGALELVPALLGAAVAGTACALLLLAVTGRGVDLAALTGADGPLGLLLDAQSWVVATAVLVAVVGLVAVAGARHGRQADERRRPEERETA